MSSRQGMPGDVILANNPFFEALHNAVSTGPSSDDVMWFWAGAAILAVIVGIGIRYATRRDGPKARPRRDYLTLGVDLLGLTEEDRRDLLRIAAAAGRDEPASILLSPMCLARAAQAATTKDRSTERQPRVQALCERLFDQPCPEIPAESAAIATPEA